MGNISTFFMFKIYYINILYKYNGNIITEII